MFITTDTIAEGSTERARICIFGAGVAGLAMAEALTAAGVEVLLIEAGGLSLDPASQEMYDGEVRGDPYFKLPEARQRMFGGSTETWGGVCRPMQPQTFTAEPANGVTGWPITYDDLAPFEAAAAAVLDVPGGFTDTALGAGLYKMDFQVSVPPVHLGRKYRALAETGPGLRVALDTALIDLETSGGEIVAATVISGETRRWRIEAEAFVLAMGGIEVPRMLMWLNDRHDGALIANHDLIGRYFHEHLHTIAAHGWFHPDAREILGTTRAFFGLKAGEDGGPISRVNFEYEHLNGEKGTPPSGLARLLGLVPGAGVRLAEAMGRDFMPGSIFTTHSEQLPEGDNRITLAAETDRLGIPRPILHWTRSAADRQIITEEARRFVSAFNAAGLGQARVTAWVRDPSRPMYCGWRTAVWHHMGGTRMAETPETGIVDRDLKVFDQENLFIAGCSVFPTGDHANPTFTIAQLSLRLADHLRATFA